MKTLYIDTHLYDIDIILFDNDEIINRKTIVDKKYNSTYLMPTLKEVCPNKDFDEIVVINGPGSFTGVRLGITIAKTLAFTMDVPIKEITYFDLMNISSNDGKHIYAISDGNGSYVAEFLKNKQVGDIKYLNNKEYREFADNNIIETNVAIDFSKLIPYLKTISSVNPHSVKPIYIKLIGVEQ